MKTLNYTATLATFSFFLAAPCWTTLVVFAVTGAALVGTVVVSIAYPEQDEE